MKEFIRKKIELKWEEKRKEKKKKKYELVRRLFSFF